MMGCGLFVYYQHLSRLFACSPAKNQGLQFLSGSLWADELDSTFYLYLKVFFF
jgi:hypothetical protein